MYVCICQGIPDSQIRDAVFGGASSVREVRKQLGVMSQCGKCGVTTQKIVAATLAAPDMPMSSAQFYSAA